MTIDRRALIQGLIHEAKELKLCGPSDDPDEITAVTSAYYYLLTQFKIHATRILPLDSANMLRALDVEINNIYSVYEAKAKLDALLPDILDALEQVDEPEPPAVTRWYLELRKIVRDIAMKAMDALEQLNAGNEEGAQPINAYLKRDYQRLQTIWNEQVEGDLPTNLGRHIGWGMANDYRDIIRRDLPELEAVLGSGNK